MEALRIVLKVLLVLTSVLVVLLVLLHKGKGGGLSDMFGGGISSGAGSSGVAERNLNRIDRRAGAALDRCVIILLGLIQRFELKGRPWRAGVRSGVARRCGPDGRGRAR